jgi:hypothetical protein
MFVSAGAPHIPYARFRAALEAADLAFIVRHAERLSFGLADAVEVCLLIYRKAPERLQDARLRWIRRYAAEVDGQQWEDYRLIVDAFDAMPGDPELALGRLLSLCSVRGLGR